MAVCSILDALAILLCFVGLSNQESVLGIDTDDFDFDGLPGVQHEFKIDVLAGREECFFQKVKTGAQLHMSFEVLRGSDRNIDVIIKAPNGRIIDKHLWAKEGSTDKQIEHEGIYAFCLDNSFSRFSAKLVYFYLVTYVVEEWERFTEEIKNFDGSVENVTGSLMNVDKAVMQMRKFQALGRQHAITDWYIISERPMLTLLRIHYYQRQIQEGDKERKDVRLPMQMQRAMAAEAEASREAKAKVIAAEGEHKASRALKEAADIISQSPATIQLRYLQTLNTIAAEKNSTIIFPLPMDLLGSLIKK